MRALPARLVAATLTFLFLAVGAAAEPPALPVVDPLALRVEDAAALDGANRPAPDGVERPAVEPTDRKLAGSVWQHLADPAEMRVIVLLAPAATAPAGKAAEDEETHVRAVAEREQSFARRARALGLAATGGLSHFPVVFGSIAGKDLLALAALPEVAAIEEDLPLHASRVEGGALMRATQLRAQLGGAGAGIGVAVIDSGIDDNHPELASRVVVQGDFTGTTGDGTIDDAGHGTAVAGIIAGASGGMAPAARLWALKVLDANGSASTSWVLAALNAAYANRNQFGGLRLVNLSLGGGGARNSDCDALYPAEASVVDSLVAAGIAVFAAAGNDGFAAGISAPACLSGAIAVGAVYDADLGGVAFRNCSDPVTGADRVTCYSNSGAPLDLLAPSHCARTPMPGGGYESCFGGTSAASPYATGVAAQILSLQPGTTPAQLRAALVATGRPVADPFTGLVRPRVDALAAYQALAPAAGACLRDAATSCLLGGRFEVKVDWQTAGGTGSAGVMGFGGQRAESDQSAFLWFFDPANFELGVKMVDACAPPFNAFWVFLSGLTDQGYTVRIRDTATGATRTYTNPSGQLAAPVADTAAFPCS